MRSREQTTLLVKASLDLHPAVIADLPLRGEWRALNTPAERVPSHGTDWFGQRYAYDFVRMDEKGARYGEHGLARQFLGAVPVDRFYCWAQPVYAAFGGRVLAVGEGWPDRARVNAIRELVRSNVAPPRPLPHDWRPLLGNFVMIEGDEGVAVYAHLRRGSIAVDPRDVVAAGSPIGQVGNSGNTSMPHLHFQVMDDPDPFRARGVLCTFRNLERWDGRRWIPAPDGVPALFERVRAPADSRAL